MVVKSRRLIIFYFTLLLLAALIGGVVIFFSFGGEEKIIIRADSDLGAPVQAVGITLGITYDSSKDYTETIDVLSKLRPASWRIGTAGVYDFAVNKARFPQKYNTSITLVIQDIFNEKYGYPVIVGDCTDPKAWGEYTVCFATFEELKKTWSAFVDSTMKYVVASNLIINYYDIFPEGARGWESGITQEQQLELFKIAHNIIRKYIPEAKIVVPSTADYDKDLLAAYLLYAERNNLRIDALSWHEFRTPKIIPGHVEEIKKFISSRVYFCNPTCPEIHINEYAPPETSFGAGPVVAWNYYLEKAGVEQSNRACWDTPEGWSTCWAGFNGLLLEDDTTPTHLYWVYKWLADTKGYKRLDSYSTTNDRVVALARKDDSLKELRIIVGRYGNRNGRVQLKIENYPYGSDKVGILIEQIPDNENLVSALNNPTQVSAYEDIVTSGTINVGLTNFKNREAYLITIQAIP